MADEEEENMSSDLQEYKPGNELLVVDCTKGWRELTCIEYPGMDAILF